MSQVLDKNLDMQKKQISNMSSDTSEILKEENYVESVFSAKMNHEKTIGEDLKAIRTLFSMTQADLADELWTSRRLVNFLENNDVERYSENLLLRLYYMTTSTLDSIEDPIASVYFGKIKKKVNSEIIRRKAENNHQNEVE